MTVDAVERRFGPYGGRYVPETLIPALDSVERCWAEARDDPGFRSELVGLRWLPRSHQLSLWQRTLAW